MHQDDPLCHWCKQETVLADWPNSIQPDNAATVDHLFSKLDPRRYEPGGELAKVLACHACNSKRAVEEHEALGQKEIDRRVRRFRGEPEWIPTGSLITPLITKDMVKRLVKKAPEERRTVFDEEEERMSADPRPSMNAPVVVEKVVAIMLEELRVWFAGTVTNDWILEVMTKILSESRDLSGLTLASYFQQLGYHPDDKLRVTLNKVRPITVAVWKRFNASWVERNKPAQTRHVGELATVIVNNEPIPVRIEKIVEDHALYVVKSPALATAHGRAGDDRYDMAYPYEEVFDEL